LPWNFRAKLTEIPKKFFHLVHPSKCPTRMILYGNVGNPKGFSSPFNLLELESLARNGKVFPDLIG